MYRENFKYQSTRLCTAKTSLLLLINYVMLGIFFTIWWRPEIAYIVVVLYVISMIGGFFQIIRATKLGLITMCEVQLLPIIVTLVMSPIVTVLTNAVMNSFLNLYAIYTMFLIQLFANGLLTIVTGYLTVLLLANLVIYRLR